MKIIFCFYFFHLKGISVSWFGLHVIHDDIVGAFHNNINNDYSHSWLKWLFVTASKRHTRTSEKNRQSRTTCSYFCRREIKNQKRFGMPPWQNGSRSPMFLLSYHFLFLILIDVGGYIRSATPAAQQIRVVVDSHLMLSKHVNSVCKPAFLKLKTLIITWEEAQ